MNIRTKIILLLILAIGAYFVPEMIPKLHLHSLNIDLKIGEAFAYFRWFLVIIVFIIGLPLLIPHQWSKFR